MIDEDGKVYEVNSLTAMVKLHEFIEENPIDDVGLDYDLRCDCECNCDRLYRSYCEQVENDPDKEEVEP